MAKKGRKFSPSDRAPRAFISYSRHDEAVVGRLSAALGDNNIEFFIDSEAIGSGEAWQERLYDLIVSSDVVVFMLSENSVNSRVCAWEVETARKLGKRIVPVAIDPELSPEAAPKSLQALNFVFATNSDNESDSIRQLVEAIRIDIAWVRQTTRLIELAEQWRVNGHQKSSLLRGTALREARAHIDAKPSDAPDPASSLTDFLLKSYSNERKRRQWFVLSSAFAFSVIVGLSALSFLQFDRASQQADRASQADASADFRSAALKLQRKDSYAEGMAELARAVRRDPDGPARIRIISELREQPIWVPMDLQAPNGQPAPLHFSTALPDSDLEPVNFRGQPAEVNSASKDKAGTMISRDIGHPVFTPFPVRSRVWSADGKALTDWLIVPGNETGDLGGGVRTDLQQSLLSPSGRFLVLRVLNWRGREFLSVFHIGSGNWTGPFYSGERFSSVEFVIDGEREFLVYTTSNGKAGVLEFREQWPIETGWGPGANKILEVQHDVPIAVARLFPDQMLLASADNSGEVQLTQNELTLSPSQQSHAVKRETLPIAVSFDVKGFGKDRSGNIQIVGDDVSQWMELSAGVFQTEEEIHTFEPNKTRCLNPRTATNRISKTFENDLRDWQTAARLTAKLTNPQVITIGRKGQERVISLPNKITAICARSDSTTVFLGTETPEVFMIEIGETDSSPVSIEMAAHTIHKNLDFVHSISHEPKNNRILVNLASWVSPNSYTSEGIVIDLGQRVLLAGPFLSNSTVIEDHPPVVLSEGGELIGETNRNGDVRSTRSFDVEVPSEKLALMAEFIAGAAINDKEEYVTLSQRQRLELLEKISTIP